MREELVMATKRRRARGSGRGYQIGRTSWISHHGPEGKRKGERIKDVSNSESNRELGILKLIFNLALKGGRIGSKPYIELLDEPAPCEGFFEREQIVSVLAQLASELAAVVEFAYITGW